MDKKTVVHELVKEGVKELIIREGVALTLEHPKNVNISGTITAPLRFITERKEDFIKNESHVLVDRSNRSIILVLKEQQVNGNYSVKGQIKIGKKFSDLGINDSSVQYSPIELSKKLKMLRSLFESPTEHATVVNSLRNISAKLKQDLDAKDDSRGNVSASFEQTLESNIPSDFTIEIPLIEGEPKVKVKVGIFITGNSYSSLSCYLESVDAADLIEKAIDDIIDREIKPLSEYAVIIEQ